MASLAVAACTGLMQSHPQPQEPTMISRGQTLENAVTGERFTFTDTASSTGGGLLAFDFALRPGGAVPIPHVHPVQTERFEVVAGVVHAFANAGDEEARLRVEVRPAGRMEEMFAEVVALAEAGSMTRRGM